MKSFSHYIRCTCDLEGKIKGSRCPYCDGWGVLLEEMPPKPKHDTSNCLNFTGETNDR